FLRRTTAESRVVPVRAFRVAPVSSAPSGAVGASFVGRGGALTGFFCTGDGAGGLTASLGLAASLSLAAGGVALTDGTMGAVGSLGCSRPPPLTLPSPPAPGGEGRVRGGGTTFVTFLGAFSGSTSARACTNAVQ